MSEPVETESPAPDELADENDELDWDVEVVGRMRDYATDDEPLTVPVEEA